MRLILNSIVLHNFKSYKGTHTIKDIDKSFTAIVGPNGSGKSNVIDSILFVLGFRAKKMRHQQVTDLIYSDGQRESEAFVELIFNKFRVKRSINLNKSTKYFLDNSETTSSNIIKIMMEEGVDMEFNRFLILQGEIESIAMMKPKESSSKDGLLEFLENIIGTSSYKKEIEDVQNEIKNLEQLKTDAQTSLNFIKKDYDHAEILKNQNEKAVKEKIDFLIKNNELFNLKNILLTQKKIEAEDLKNKISNEIENLRSTNEETKKIFETYEGKFLSLKKLLNQKEGAFLNAKRDFKKAEIQKEIKNKLEKKIKNLKEEIKQNEVKKLEKEIYLKELKENEEDLAILNKKIEKNKEKLSKTKRKGEYALLKAEEDKLIKLIDQKSEITRKKSEILAKIKIKENEKSKIEEEKVQLEIKIREIEKGFKEGFKVDGLGLKNEVGRSDPKSKGDPNTNLDLYTSEIKSKLTELNKDIQITQKELIKRKRRQDDLNQMKESDLKEKEIISNLKGIKGVLGRLKDLGEVDPKYEIALRSSCNRMNNIIVDTVQNADKVMDFIKKKNIPRTTLIVLEKIKEIPPLEEQPIPYLYKLIDCEEKFKKIFYFALTDTLICENLKEAEKYAFSKKRKRVVTLDGKLIEKSGVMTGGKVIEKIKSYEELEKSLLKMENIKKENEEKLKNLEEMKRIGEYKEKVRRIKGEIGRIEEEISRMKEECDREEGGSSKEKGGKGKGTPLRKDSLGKSKGKSPLGKSNPHNPLETLNLPNNPPLSLLDSQIQSTKDQIQILKNKLENSLDSDLKEVQIDLKIQNEKIEIIEKRNQDIKIFLSDLPIQNGDKENQLLLAENEIKKIKINEIEGNKKKFKAVEEEYNLILKSFKESQEEMNNLKKKMGDNYHNEIDLKNKYEDLEEKIEEYLKEKGRMEEKMKKVENEIKGLRGMVGDDLMGDDPDKVEDKEVIEVDLGKDKGVKNTKKSKGVNKSKSKGKALNKPLDPDPTLTNPNLNNDPLTLNNTLTNNTLNLKDLDLHIKNLSLSLSKYSPKEILPGVFEEFNLLKSSLEKAQNDFNLINDSYKSKRNRIQNLKSKRYEEFMEGFKLISKNLKEIYKSLTYGGNAELELVDYLDPFSEGVVLAVMPPKKCWKNVNNLSGGEKTLSSLSLIFALHKYKPSPFYVMDEIDAALDYRNVSIISNYIKEMTRNSQFIVISLRSDMFEMSKSILGIYKTRNISKFLMIKVDKING